MNLEIRPVVEDELAAFVAVLEAAAGRHAGAETVPDRRASYALDRTLAAFDGGRMVGGTASEVVELTVPGPATVRAAKITLTGLLPTHRRRGLASAFMRHQLQDLRARGEPLAILTTAQAGVPARHGFAPATRALAVEIAPRASLGRALPPGRVRLTDVAEARSVLPGVYDCHRVRVPGQVSRSPGFWQGWFLDDPLVRIGPSERFVLLAEDGTGACDGYLTYRLAYGVLREQPVEELLVEDLIALTDEARAALWSYCLDFDQARRVSAWNVPVDDPLPWIAADRRAVRVTAVRDFVQLRLVDVPRALASRRYQPGSLVLEVADEVLGDNAGRYALHGDSDGATCTPTTSPADLALSVAELAAVYLGGADFAVLAGAGRVEERTAGSVARADAMFRSGPAPWTVTDW